MHEPVCLEHEGAKTLVIFIHGFMGSPAQFSDWMEAVYGEGYSVVSVLLPGHGSTVKVFTSHGLADWESYLQSEINRFADKYDKIYLIGHSMGGLLALNVSLDEKNKISGVFMISSPLRLCTFSPKSLAMRLKFLLLPRNHKIKSAYLSSNSISDWSFFVYPSVLKPYLSLDRLLEKTKKNLKDVTVPVFMVFSKNDETTSYESAELFYNGLTRAHKKVLTINKSWHAYFNDAERAEIREEMLRFLSPEGSVHNNYQPDT